MNKGVKYVVDILKEVAKEQGRPLEEIEEVWRLHREYVKETIRDEQTYIVEFPQIGNLYFSGFLYRAMTSKNKEKSEKLRRKADKLYEKINSSKEREGKTRYIYPQSMRPNILKLYKSIQYNIHNSDKRYSTSSKVIKEIEEYSNNNNNE